MQSYFQPAASASRPFIVTPYRVEDGVLVPVVPDRCIAGEPGIGCWIVLDHWRDRKSGPCFPLAVMRCAVHEVAFTLYPCGHVPYGTAAVAPVGPAGEELDPGVCTMFEAASDAAGGRAWSRETPRDEQGRLLEPPEGWWSTQGRRIELATRIVGVAPEVGDRDRERIAEVLGVELLDVAEAHRQDGEFWF